VSRWSTNLQSRPQTGPTTVAQYPAAAGLDGVHKKAPYIDAHARNRFAFIQGSPTNFSAIDLILA
jgi:hypothetical protein